MNLIIAKTRISVPIGCIPLLKAKFIFLRKSPLQLGGMDDRI